MELPCHASVTHLSLVSEQNGVFSVVLGVLHTTAYEGGTIHRFCIEIVRRASATFAVQQFLFFFYLQGYFKVILILL